MSHEGETWVCETDFAVPSTEHRGFHASDLGVGGGGVGFKVPLTNRRSWVRILKRQAPDSGATGGTVLASPTEFAEPADPSPFRRALGCGTAANTTACAPVQRAQADPEVKETIPLNEDDEAVLDEMFPDKEVNPWDCQTIVSTYSNLENHPGAAPPVAPEALVEPLPLPVSRGGVRILRRRRHRRRAIWGSIVERGDLRPL